MDESALFGKARNEHTALLNGRLIIEGNVAFLFVDAIVALVAILCENWSDFLFKELPFFRRERLCAEGCGEKRGGGEQI